jgi:hypothetical protein
MEEIKLNIAFFGFYTKEIINAIRQIIVQLSNFEVTYDHFDDNEFKGFFEKEISFKNNSRIFNIMAHFPESENNYLQLLKELKESDLEIKKYLNKNFKKEIDYYFLIYNDNIKFLIEYLISISNNNYCLIKPDNKQLNCEILENNTIISLNDNSIDEKIFKFFNQIYPLHSKYKEFIKCSKENYYNKFSKYFRKYIELNSKSEEALFEIFNSFELYSFDSKDFNDESIIILQILSSRNFDKINVNVEKFYCENCGKKKRSLFNKKFNLFLCDKCNPNNRILKKNEVQCRNCKVIINKDQMSLFIISFCCNNCFCSHCIKKKIKEQMKNKEKTIKCFCGEIIYDEIIENILGEDYAKYFNE